MSMFYFCHRISLSPFAIIKNLFMHSLCVCIAKKSLAYTLLLYETVFHADFSLRFSVSDKCINSSHLLTDLFTFVVHTLMLYLPVILQLPLVVTRCVTFGVNVALLLQTGSGGHRGAFFIESFLSLNRGQSCWEMPHWVLISGFIWCKCLFWENQRWAGRPLFKCCLRGC